MIGGQSFSFLRADSYNQTSTVMSTVIVGIASQVWLKKYGTPYTKYNYILGGVLDGGAQLMIFILSLAVFGAAGVQRPFPSVRFYTSVMSYLTVGWKPCGVRSAKGSVDYCNGNGALSRHGQDILLTFRVPQAL